MGVRFVRAYFEGNRVFARLLFLGIGRSRAYFFGNRAFARFIFEESGVRALNLGGIGRLHAALS